MSMRSTLLPIIRLIRRHGQNLTLERAAPASLQRPWRTVDHTPSGQTLKGVVQMHPANADSSVPEGGLRGIAVLVVDKPQVMPSPGDYLSVNQGRWRIQTVLTVGKHQESTIIEAILAGQVAS